MIANCDVLITRFSSTIFPALALGKEVYCNIDIEEYKKIIPIQNGGTSAKVIAEVSHGNYCIQPNLLVRAKEKNKYIEDLKLELKYLLKTKTSESKIVYCNYSE